MHKDRSGHSATSNTIINDTDDMAHADRHVSLQEFELAFNLHVAMPVHCPQMSQLLQNVRQISAETTIWGCWNNYLTNRRTTEWPPHWPTYNIAKVKVITSCHTYAMRCGWTTTDQRQRWNSWYGSISHHLQRRRLRQKGEGDGNICLGHSGDNSWWFHTAWCDDVMMSIVAYQVSLQCTKEVMWHLWPGLLTQGVLQLHHEVRLTPTLPPTPRYAMYFANW